MRVVVDANVLISAALKAWTTPYMVKDWIDHNAILLKSRATGEEVLRRCSVGSWLP